MGCSESVYGQERQASLQADSDALARGGRAAKLIQETNALTWHRLVFLLGGYPYCERHGSLGLTRGKPQAADGQALKEPATTSLMVEQSATQGCG
jgi:hypothetical protein